MENDNQTAFQSTLSNKFGEDEEVKKSSTKKKKRKYRKVMSKKEFGVTKISLDFKEEDIESLKKSLDKLNKHKKLMQNKMIKDIKDKRIISNSDSDYYSMFNNYFDNSAITSTPTIKVDERYHNNSATTKKEERVFGSENKSYNVKHSIYDNEVEAALLTSTGAFFSVNEKKIKGSLDSQKKSTFIPESKNLVNFETESGSKLKVNWQETILNKNTFRNSRKIIKQHNLSNNFFKSIDKTVYGIESSANMADIVSTAGRNLIFLNSENVVDSFTKNTAKMADGKSTKLEKSMNTEKFILVPTGMTESLQPTRVVVSEELKKSSIQKGKKLRQKQANKIAFEQDKTSIASELESTDRGMTTSLSAVDNNSARLESSEKTNKFISVPTGIAESLQPTRVVVSEELKKSNTQKKKRIITTQNKSIFNSNELNIDKNINIDDEKEKKSKKLKKNLPFEKRIEISSILLENENKGKSFKDSLNNDEEELKKENIKYNSFEKNSSFSKNSVIGLQNKINDVVKTTNSLKNVSSGSNDKEFDSGQTAEEVIDKSLIPARSSLNIALKKAVKKNEDKLNSFFSKKSSFASDFTKEHKSSQSERFKKYRKKFAKNNSLFDFSNGVKKAIIVAKETIKTFTPTIEKNKIGIIGCLIAIILFSLVTSCSTVLNDVNMGLIASSYMVDDEDISKATAYYTKLEADLQSKIIKNIKSAENNSRYNEVRYNIDNFQHSPENLIAFLSAEFPGWSFDIDLLDWGTSLITGTQYNTVKKYEHKLFEEQYEYKEETIVEIHYTKDNKAIKWKVRVFTLKNKGFNNVINSKMNDEVKEYYNTLKDFRGNRVWFGTPVKYKWTSTIANLFGYMIEGTNRLVNIGSASSNDFSSDSAKNGEIITLPNGLGSVFTYMGWQTITSPSSQQYKLRQTAGENYDSEGFAKIGDRYVVACTLTYGNVGDYIDVYQSDGTILKCIIGDIKNQSDSGCNKWGHQQGQCVIEFVVNKNMWYGSGHSNPGTSTCHPEWGGKTIVKIANVGSFSKGDVPVQDSQNANDNNSSIGTISNISMMTSDVIEHKGIDIAGLSTSEVLSIFDGEVIKVSDNTIDVIDTEHNYKATYSSLSNISVHNHQYITKGNKIATMADTEGIGVVHLHLEIKDIKNNIQLNPYLYVDIGRETAPVLSNPGAAGSGAIGQLVAGNSSLGNRIAELALTRVGYMYYWGGGHSMAEISNPNTTRLDCSGLVNWAYYQAGASIGINNTKSLATLGREIPLNEAQPGDIILYSSNGNASGIHHVTICIGGGNYVEAPYDNHPICTGKIYTKGIYSVRRLINY